MNLFRKTIPWILTLLLMISIFYLSHQSAEESKDLSNKTEKVIIDILNKIIPGDSIEINIVSHTIRKSAHFFLYFLMGILIRDGLRNMGINGWRALALAMTICILYAISDEVHQLFIVGRSGELRDVFIDGSGSLVGIFIYNIGYYITGLVNKKR